MISYLMLRMDLRMRLSTSCARFGSAWSNVSITCAEQIRGYHCARLEPNLWFCHVLFDSGVTVGEQVDHIGNLLRVFDSVGVFRVRIHVIQGSSQRRQQAIPTTQDDS